MNSYSRIDRQSLQTFLANAFAVQESGLDSKSLSALAEIQRFIGSEEFNQDRAMSLITDHALHISGASGVGIALLQGSELVYRAGSGSAVQDVGRHMPAVLSASSTREVRREILRVENAACDRRIEADICRQFGAMSLLMLPFYKEHALAGVLQVLFDAPHTFGMREIRAYRLMVGLLEEGIAVHPMAAPELAPENSQIRMPDLEAEAPQYLHSVENIAKASAILAQVGQRGTLEEQAMSSLPASAEPKAEVRRPMTGMINEAGAFWNLLKSTIRGVSHPLTLNSLNSVTAIGAAIILIIAVWIAGRSRSSTANISQPVTTSSDGQSPLPATPQRLNEPLKLSQSEWKENPRPSPAFRRVRVGLNEVDYVAEDVTIRRFDIGIPSALVRSDIREVKFGDDVTVRYFPKPASTSKVHSKSAVQETVQGKETADR